MQASRHPPGNGPVCIQAIHLNAGLFLVFFCKYRHTFTKAKIRLNIYIAF